MSPRNTQKCLGLQKENKRASYRLNCVPAKDVVILTPPEHVNVTLFGIKIFADHQVKMKSLGWALI